MDDNKPDHGEGAKDDNLSDSDSDESYYDENEVDELLEEALPEDLRRAPKRRKLNPEEHDLIKSLGNSNAGNSNSTCDKADKSDEADNVEGEEEGEEDSSGKYNEKTVMVLEEKGKSKFDDLPGGWIQVRHVSGMPLYLHRKTRICTLSKPYRLGPGSARRHSMPLSAIPCLAYRKALQREAEKVSAVYRDKSDSTPDNSNSDVRVKVELDQNVAEKLEESPTESINQVEPFIFSQTRNECLISEPNASESVSAVPSEPAPVLEAAIDFTPASSATSVTPPEIGADYAPTPVNATQNTTLNAEINNHDEVPMILESVKVESAVDSPDNELEPGEIPDDEDVDISGNGCPVGDIYKATGYVQTDASTADEKTNSDELNKVTTAFLATTTAKYPTTPIHERLKLFMNDKNLTADDLPDEAKKNMIPKAQVETSQVANELNSVNPEELREYCMKLFKFKQFTCKRFKSWRDRRKHTKEQKRLHLQRPTLPEGVQLITFPVQRPAGESDSGKAIKEYTMNPQGKSSVCILHEYVQHALRMQPSYTFGEIRNSASPYAATVMINNVKYGIGYGTSKKLAKASAAAATLEILIPEMKDMLKTNGSTSTELHHIGYFDQVEMDDPRIPKMCASVSEPSPYALLLACLQRNFGQGSTSDIKFEVVSTNGQANRFRMQTGEHSVEVTASNKREGKQLASQALLCKIHPHIKNFGSFLRLYGNGSIKSVKEKKQEEQQITTLQSKASANSPNYAILNKLKEEMLKLREKREQQKTADENNEMLAIDSQ